MPSCGRTIKQERRAECRRRFPRIGPGLVALACLLLAGGAVAQGQDASLYKEALTREAALREDLAALRATESPEPLYERIRVMVGAFEDIDRLFPESDYGDDALWHGAVLAADLFERSGNPGDRTTAVRLFEKLAGRFPGSELTQKAAPLLARLQAAPGNDAAPIPGPAAAPSDASSPPATATPATQEEQAPSPAPVPTQGAGTATAPPPRPASPAAATAARPTPPQATTPSAASQATSRPAAPPATAPQAPSQPAASSPASQQATSRAEATRPPSQPQATTPAAASPATSQPAAPPASQLATSQPEATRPPSQQQDAAPAASRPEATRPAAKPQAAPAPAASQATSRPAATPPRAPAPRPAALLRAVQHELLREVVRVTLTLEREVTFTDTRVTNPPRLVVDLQNVIPDAPVRDAIVTLGDPMIRRLHVIGPSGGRTRIAIDLGGRVSYSVYALYNPFRLVIDFERGSRAGAAVPGGTARSAERILGAAPPRPPAANARGGFSIARQLGLAAGRIVIDPGHGGHDPGTEVAGLTESALVLDVALRLERLLKDGNHADVILTRRDDTYVALEERTELANRAGADLFLSIHANAHKTAGVRGVETYVLSFAGPPEAEALAARENAASSRSMRDLPDLVRAIATDNKHDESRDFARLVQSALYDRLRTVNKELKNLGVKQAPFMVLVGARMPAILAEVAFMTNKQEAALLRMPKYRQQIAEALLAGITRYQETLKKPVLAAGS